MTARDSYARRFAEESGEKTTEGELNRPECDAALRSKDRLETAHEVVDLEFEDGGSSPYGDRDPFLRRNCGRPLGIGD